MTGARVQTSPARKSAPKSVQRLVMKVTTNKCSLFTLYLKTTGVSGATGAPAVTPVAGITTGLVSVLRAPAPLALAAMETARRQSLALMLTQVFLR